MLLCKTCGRTIANTNPTVRFGYCTAHRPNYDVLTIQDVIEGLEMVKDGAQKLWSVYEENDNLNNIQPSSCSEVIPMSLDDWYHALQGCLEDWRKKEKEYERETYQGRP